ncbi:60 kDa lysophospholipase [Holothuria leucospilota]|uniref:asparaginase n=1 Tax=Holothuria leucospilota TaxID=206669 RepID=A0A9Q1C4A8_HOLLE|nr:60 kDa lysophospholipase [Holothuria leucospilota]
MVEDVETNYEQYDGFVILHGTDTMAYTSSALSFMLDGLSKPVVLTGAQIPIYEMMTDGVDNLLNALYVAAESRFPEVHVTLLFGKTLYRGNRVTKVSSVDFQAYESPNIKPLLIFTAEERQRTDVNRVKRDVALQCHKSMSKNVGILLIYPGITPQTIRESLRPPIQGLVLLTFGSGNCPSRDKGLLNEIKAATSRGVIIVNCSQCLKGFVFPSYETGSVLLEAGVLPGNDMTKEAAFAKLSYVLGQSGMSHDQRKNMMLRNIHKEITEITDTDNNRSSVSALRKKFNAMKSI